MKKLIVLLFSCLLGISTAFAQVDEVTLVVSGEGESLDKATTIALRSAIEQAYGAFVSANTTILNDELVQDEIVTVSSGNVKKYDILNSYDKENGHVFVTLRAIVSVKAMTAYAQSKGAECEFAGATIWQRKKLEELNIDAEKKAFDNMLMELRQIAPHMFDFKISSGGSIAGEKANISISVSIIANENYKAFNDLITTTMIALDRGSDVGGLPWHIRYSNPIYETRKKPKTLIGILFSPVEALEKDCHFYNQFPLYEIQKIIISAARHFYVYDNNNKLYLFGYIVNDRGEVWNIKQLEKNDYYIVSSNFRYNQCCWLQTNLGKNEGTFNTIFDNDKCILSDRTSAEVPACYLKEISKFFVSKETNEFINTCDKIDADSLSSEEWMNLYATSTFMGCKDSLLHIKHITPYFCRIIRDAYNFSLDEYFSFLLSQKLITQEVIDTYFDCENKYNECYQEHNKAEWDKDYKKANKTKQKMDEYLNCMNTILLDYYWYYEE